MARVAGRSAAVLVAAVLVFTGGPAALAIGDPGVEGEGEVVAEADDGVVVVDETIILGADESGDDQPGADGAGEGEQEQPDSEDPQGSVPEQPVVSAAVADSAVLLTWPRAGNDAAITGYVVQKLHGDQWLDLVTDLPADATEYTASGLLNGQEHAFRVAAINQLGTGAWAEVLAFAAGIPDPPSVSGVATASGASLTWVPGDGPEGPATHWVLERSVDGGNWALIDESTTTARVDEGHAPGTRLSYRIASVNAAGQGPWSDVVAVTVGPLPLKPTAAAKPSTSGSVVLTWTAAVSPHNDVQSYTVEYSGPDGRWHPVATLAGTARTHTVTGLTNGTTYTFRVDARNAIGESGWAPVSATPRTVTSAPRSVAVTAANKSLTVRWTAPSSTGGTTRTYYVVQYSTAGEPWKTASSTVKPTATSYTITGLANGTAYRVQVLARNAAGTSKPSSSVSATPRTVSSAPRTVKVTAGKSSLVVRWAAPSASGGTSRTAYVVQYSTDGRTWKVASSSVKPSATSYTISGLKNGTTYRVRVLAGNAAGTSAASSSVSATPRTVSSAPRSIKVTPGNAAITVRWVAPSSSGGASRTAYVVQYSTDGRTWKVASSSVKPTASSYKIAGLKNGTSYRVRVLARNAAGTSAASSTVSAKPRTVASSPKIRATSSGSGKVKISWTAPSNGGAAITGYAIQQYSGGKWHTVQTVGASARSVTISGLTNGTSYRFRVLAKNAAGNGKWSTVLPAKPKKPAPTSKCHPAYTGACVPIASDVDCAGGSGNGPAYVRGPVYVRGDDPYDLDRDGDGVACER